MSNKTEIWKKASEVFSDISDLSPKQALAHLYGIKNITNDVRDAVITLINCGSQASQYFSKEILPNYNVELNNQKNFQPGQILDEYELLEELGQGGMSQVFKAKRTNTDQQTFVALKIFAPRNNSKELFNHFINEQKILSELSHQNIVKMLHGGMTDDETAYLVMELIESAQPLDTYSKQNKLGTRNKIKLIAQCADALAYSHANLIIHRDLKPDNILINKNKKLKIVDFGIAKLINNDISGNKTTILALTPSYAAPEQINSRQITVKTDIFSLAVVALELLTEEEPLPKDRLLKSCANDEVHLDKVFKSLNCSKDLKNILRKALEQEPNKRYSSMQSFADDLNNYLLYKPVNATSQSFVYRIQKFAKRRAALFATMVSFVVFLIVGSFLGYQQYQQIKIEASKAEIVKQFMLDAFEVTDPNNTQGIEISSKDLLKLASDKLENNKTIDPEIKFELLQTLGLANGKLGNFNKAIELLNRSLEINPKNSKSISNIARYLYYSGQNEKLNQLLTKTNIEEITSATDKARFYRTQARVHVRNMEISQAYDFLEKANKSIKTINDPIESIISNRLLALLKYYESKPQEGINILTKVLDNSNLEHDNTLRLGIESDLATLYDDVGKPKHALTVRLKIIEQQRKILGNRHPDLSKSLLELSISYRKTGQLQKAQKVLNEAYDISNALYGINNKITADILNTIAIQQEADGKPFEAIDTLYKVKNIYTNLKLEYSIEANEYKTNLAQILVQVDRNQESYDIIKDVYNYQKEKLGPTNFSTLESQQILARVLVDLNRIDEAIELAELAVKNAQGLLKTSKNLALAGSYFSLAKIYQSNKQYTLAIKNFLEIIDKKLINDNGIEYAVLTSSLARLYQETDEKDHANKFYQDSINRHKNLFSISHIRTLHIQIRYAEFLKLTSQTKKSQHLFATIDSIIAENKIEDDRIINLLAKSR